MTSFLRGNVVRILTLALALFGTGVASVAFSQTIDSNVNDYVTIKLKDGRVLEGPVLLENDQQITIESQFANGTITRKDQIDKSDIASISHMSAADRDQRLATIAYHELGKYQLDPQNSYPLAYYDTAINDGFRHFLMLYPHALEVATVTERLAGWQEERDKVASGQVKYHGQWMPAVEANKLAETERTQQIIQDARASLAEGQFEAASAKLALYYNGAEPTPLVAESRRLQADVYRMWISSLETAREQLTKDLEATKDRVARLSETRQRAQANYDQARDKSLNTTSRTLGDNTISSQASADYLRAEKQYNEEQNRQFAIQEQLDNTIRLLRQVHQEQDLFTAAYPSVELAKETPPPKTNAPAPPETNAPAPPPRPPPPPTVLDQMGAWFSRNWIIVAGVALLGLWGVSRLFTRS
ncbi:MAG: hypothetical protein ABSA12_14960 [Verrucomicrobiia bacterium]